MQSYLNGNWDPVTMGGMFDCGQSLVAGRITLCEFERDGPVLHIHLGYEESSEGGHLRRFQARSTTLLRN